ncbi:NrfD/PsrC family molybdoenzyme membrane anchor subunit [Angustibacter sp. McL0619]|uniref:NrfD/PsrC family molybdoenzyme membrane anchor subunit n=1 Tax=Angustibacter sp. McL0619 TaxID=3415676 RepID=UPI003CFB8C73
MRERSLVPEPEFDSYYGRPVLKAPVWKQPDVPLYLAIGGYAGVSAILAEGAAASGRPGLERVTRVGAAVGVAAGTVALVHDLGRPERFLNMLRVFKPTSPLSVGSWILAPFGGLATAAAASSVSGRLPLLGRAAGLGAAALGAPLATYTAALLANTAVPAWHEAHRELPFLFAGSAASAAGGVALALAPLDESGPARRMAVLGTAVELAAEAGIETRLGSLAEPYRTGRPGRLRTASRALGVAGAVGAMLGRRSRTVSVASGSALAASSILLRFAVFQAGLASAKDPKYTVGPQRDRLSARRPSAATE